MLSASAQSPADHETDAEKVQSSYEQLILGVAKRLASMKDVETEDRLKPLSERKADLATLRQLMCAISLDGGGKGIPEIPHIPVPGDMSLPSAVRNLDAIRKTSLYAELRVLLVKAEKLLPSTQ